MQMIGSHSKPGSRTPSNAVICSYFTGDSFILFPEPKFLIKYPAANQIFL